MVCFKINDLNRGLFCIDSKICKSVLKNRRIFYNVLEKIQNMEVMHQNLDYMEGKLQAFGYMLIHFGNLKDTMCGMRIYPLGLVYPLLEQCNSDRMDFDIEILLLAYKTGIAFKWIDVVVKYESGVSHFKGFRDNLLISKMHAKHFFLLPQFLWTLLVKR